MSTRWLVHMGGGLWESLGRASAFPDGAAAWRAAHASGQFLSGEGSSTSSQVDDGMPLEQSFRALCPQGLVYSPNDPLPSWLTRLSSRDRRSVLKDAEYFVDHLRPRPGGGRFEVTALCSDRELKLVFLVPRGGDARRRDRWASRVRAANLAATIAGDSMRSPS